MNWFHAYGLIQGSDGNKSNHYFNKTTTTAFLMDALPGKVCNVMLNTIALRSGAFCLPLQNGMWDKAFRIAGNPDIGFNFKESPFGVDKFDALTGFPSGNLKYQDVFTGFIFYKPLEKHVKKYGFPYLVYHFQDSLIRRGKCISEGYAASLSQEMQLYEGRKFQTEILPYAMDYNLIMNLGLSIFILISFFISLKFFINQH